MIQEEFKAIIKKVEQLKKDGLVDLSLEEDLSLAIMNLVSLEEHFFFTGAKTKKSAYFNLLTQVRTLRTKLLAKMMPQNEGETWCVAKHLLAASMRLMEVGTKLQSTGDKKAAASMFRDAYELYGIFWGLRLKIIKAPDLKPVPAKIKPAWSMADILNKLVDCCDEK